MPYDVITQSHNVIIKTHEEPPTSAPNLRSIRQDIFDRYVWEIRQGQRPTPVVTLATLKQLDTNERATIWLALDRPERAAVAIEVLHEVGEEYDGDDLDATIALMDARARRVVPRAAGVEAE